MFPVAALQIRNCSDCEIEVARNIREMVASSRIDSKDIELGFAVQLALVLPGGAGKHDREAEDYDRHHEHGRENDRHPEAPAEPSVLVLVLVLDLGIDLVIKINIGSDLDLGISIHIHVRIGLLY